MLYNILLDAFPKDLFLSQDDFWDNDRFAVTLADQFPYKFGIGFFCENSKSTATFRDTLNQKIKSECRFGDVLFELDAHDGYYHSQTPNGI